MSRLIIEQNCPQCGGSTTIEEAERLFKCDFCNVSLFIIPKDYLKYYLVPKSQETDNAYYFPYWRLKGIAYTCVNSTITKQIVERSYRAVNIDYIPFTLGYRAQTQKIRFVQHEHKGRFITHEKLNERYLFNIDEANVFNYELLNIAHRVFIGENVSIIYSPYYLKDGELFDAILDRKIPSSDSESLDTLIKLPLSEDWQIKFIPTVCPNCGWDLFGERDSVVFACKNCDTLWDITESSLIKTNYFFLPPIKKGLCYLPFWRLDANFVGLELNTYTDIFRLANLPKVHKPLWDNIKAYFWAPAFKVTPEAFLRLTRHLTLTEAVFNLEEHLDLKIVNNGINLSRSSAFNSVKITLANISSDRKNFYPRLKNIDVILKDASIVYIPFRALGNELINDRLNLSIHRNNLKTAKII